MPSYPGWKESREGNGKVVRVFPIAHQNGLSAYRIGNRRYASLARGTFICTNTRTCTPMHSVPIERAWIGSHDFPQAIYKPHIGILSFSIDICVYGTTDKRLIAIRVNKPVFRGMKIIFKIAGL